MQYVTVFNVFNNVPYSTHEFPNENTLYRIAWFGLFSLNPLALSEPTVELILTPFIGTKINSYTINRKASYDYNAIRTIHVGVGQLPSLCLGAFIQNRRLVDVPDYRVETYQLVIDDVHSYIIRADSTYSDSKVNEPYIPHTYYPLPIHVRSTRCLVIERPAADTTDVRRVIIPCVELLRAYYGSSSGLVKEIIRGGMLIGANRIFDPERTGFGDDGMAYVRLRSTMDDADAATVARFALDPNVCERARSIHNSIVVNGINGDGYVPIVRPPFNGATVMTLQGKLIKTGAVWQFLAFRIMDCTGSYPFERLRYSRDNDGRSSGQKDDNCPEAYKKDWSAVKRSSDLLDEPELRSDDEPSLDGIKIDIKLASRRFSSMPLDIKKDKKDQSRHRAAESIKFKIKGNLKKFSTADGDYGETDLNRLGLSHDLNDAQENGSNRLLAFLNVLEQMRESAAPNLRYTVITIPQSSSHNDSYSRFPHKLITKESETVTFSWSILTGPSQTRRRAVIAAVEFFGRRYYLFEAETRGDADESIASLIVYKPTGDPIDDELLTRIMIHGAKQRGVWVKNWPWPNIARDKVAHRFITAQQFADRFLNYFREHTPSMEGAPLIPRENADLYNVA